MPPASRKGASSNPPKEPPKTEEMEETPKMVAMDETPIHDQLIRDLKNADPEDVTLYEEDDDPISHAGAFVDDGPDDDNAKENV